MCTLSCLITVCICIIMTVFAGWTRYEHKFYHLKYIFATTNVKKEQKRYVCHVCHHNTLGDINSDLFRLMRKFRFFLDKKVAPIRLCCFTWILLPTSWPTRRFDMVSNIDCVDKRSVVEFLDWQIASDFLTTSIWAFMSCSRQFRDWHGTWQCQPRVDTMKMYLSQIMKA